MTLALPSDASSYNVLGAWDTSTQYRGTSAQPKADMVAYLGAWWYSTFYTVGVLPTNGGGSGWALDTNGPGPNYAPVVPDAPTDLHAGYKSANAISLFWNVPMVEGEGVVTGYNIYQNGSLVGTSTINGFTVNGLQANHNYTFTVEALDQTGASGNYSLISDFGVDENPDPMDNPSITVRTDGAENLSGKYFSPYVDMTLPSTNILNISGETGLRDFTLAFAQTNFRNIAGTAFDPETGNPTEGAYDVHSGAPTLAWGGIQNTTQPTGAIINEVKALEAEGGTVTISIGGYTGFDPAVIATQYADALAETMSVGKANAKAVANLTQEYQSLITTYGVHSLDFDIENSTTVNDNRANHMRNLAIVALEAANPDLKVTFTMATTTHGLSTARSSGSGADYHVLALAKADGVHVDVVNIMAMDYYDGDTPQAAAFMKPDGTYNMLKAAKFAAAAVENQLNHLHMTDTTVGITPMIGQNDDYGQAPYDGVQEFFSLQDARLLEHWAEGKSWVSGLGEWALPRDRAGTAETHPTSPDSLGPEHSGAAQTDWQFANILNQITKGSGASATPLAASQDMHLSAAFVHEAAPGSAFLAAHEMPVRLTDIELGSLTHLHTCLV